MTLSRDPSRRRRALGAFATMALLLLVASSPFPGGCGSKVTPASMASGMSPNTSCSVVNAMVDPSCQDQMGETSSSCPSNAPLGCDTGQCCPAGFPICCANSAWCGATTDACQSEVDEPGDPPEQHGNAGTGGEAATGDSGCAAAIATEQAFNGNCGGLFPSDQGIPCGTDTSNQTCCCQSNYACASASCGGCGYCYVPTSRFGQLCGTGANEIPNYCPTDYTCIQNTASASRAVAAGQPGVSGIDDDRAPGFETIRPELRQRS